METSKNIMKRSVLLAGHRTSVTLEAPFWAELQAIAARRGISLNALVAEVDVARTGNLASALRVFILKTVKEKQKDS